MIRGRLSRSGRAGLGGGVEYHVRLALECRGALVPSPDAAHVPFYEQPGVTADSIRQAAATGRTLAIRALG